MIRYSLKPRTPREVSAEARRIAGPRLEDRNHATDSCMCRVNTWIKRLLKQRPIAAMTTAQRNADLARQVKRWETSKETRLPGVLDLFPGFTTSDWR